MALLLSLGMAVAPPPASAHQDPFHPIDHLLTEQAVRQSHVGFEVRRLSGEVLYSWGSDQLFTPASVVKLATTYAALRRLGPETRFATELRTDAPLRNGVLEGDVWLKGNGDPSLLRADLAAFVTALGELGVRHVSGDLIVDATRFVGPRYPSGWMWDDLQHGFAAPVSALSLDLNAPQAQGDMEAPEVRAGMQLSRGLAEAGITLAGTVRVGQAPSGARVLHRLASPRVAELVQRTNKESNNLFAETLVHHLGLAQASASLAAGTHAAGMAVLRETLSEAGWDAESYRLEDGSGLSRYDAVTPAQMADLLLAAARMPEAREFIGSLPVAGVDGTLAARMRGTRAQGVVLAKTGTMSGVSSLCGYVLLPGKEPLAFALMVNGFVGSARRVQQLQDAVMDALVAIADAF